MGVPKGPLGKAAVGKGRRIRCAATQRSGCLRHTLRYVPELLCNNILLTIVLMYYSVFVFTL